MASLPVRDPVGDHLLTPENAALVVIDYQPSAAMQQIHHPRAVRNLIRL